MTINSALGKFTNKTKVFAVIVALLATSLTGIVVVPIQAHAASSNDPWGCPYYGWQNTGFGWGWYGPTLRRGSTGPCVAELQGFLDYLGCTLTIDGNYGPLTANAVWQFQNDFRISTDSVAGPITQSLIHGFVFSGRGGDGLLPNC